MISRSIDLGRFFGASAVFYYHVGVFTGSPLSYWGEYAVSYFILLSGLVHTLFASGKPSGPSGYGRYLSGRVRALIPTFLIINLAIFAASYLHPSKLGRPFTVPELLLSCAGLSQYAGQRYLSTVMWFIPFIMQAYMLFPLLDRLLSRRHHAVILGLAFLVSGGLTELVYQGWPLTATEICRNWSPVFRLPEVCLGLVVGRCLAAPAAPGRGLAAVAVFAVLSLVMGAAWPARDLGHKYVLCLPWHGIVVTLVITAASVALTALPTHPTIQLLLRRLGAASFPFFLAHGIAIAFLYNRFGTRVDIWIVYFVLCWIGALAFSTLVSRLDHRRRARSGNSHHH